MVELGRAAWVLLVVVVVAAGAAALDAAVGESDRASTGTGAAIRDVRTTAASAVPVRRAGPRRPTIVERFIPFPQRRKDEMAAYSKRHYGEASYKLTNPRVIVEHFTLNDSVSATYNAFAPDIADPELHELPGVCSHFVVARDGTIVQLVSLSLRCRHTVGLNWTSFGIEHVGYSDAEILSNPRQLAASLRLTAWLRCRHNIAIKNVIGHNENRSSPYHRENVARLRSQTHGDWTKADMDVYRAKLRKRPACA
jgi:N-acetylmuramoyl-L-alanine amidase